jgi:hypothetical protein
MKKFFDDDKSGIKKNYNFLIKNHPHKLSKILKYSKKFHFDGETLLEKIYLYVNKIKKVPSVNGKKLKFWSYNKGYFKSAIKKDIVFNLDVFKNNLKQEDIKKQYKGGSISQKILNNVEYRNEIEKRYFDIVKKIPNLKNNKDFYRSSIYMFINDIVDLPLCSNCLNVTRFSNNHGFAVTCSDICEHEHYMKCRYETKEIKLPNGEILYVQGYEDKVLLELFKTNDYNDVLVKKQDIQDIIGIIKYKFKNKTKTYIPDIFLPKENLIIEVKSSYTMFCNKRKNNKKKEACLKMGLNFMFWIWDKNEKLIFKKL